MFTARRTKLVLLLVVIVGFVAGLFVGTSSAAVIHLTGRSLTIGSPVVSVSTTNAFNFNFDNPTSVGSIEFQYCNSPLQQEACVAPAGLDVSSVTLSAQSGVTGFTILSKTNSQIIISQPVATNVSGKASYTFSGATNPSFIGTFYVRILSYPSIDASGSNDSYGAVAASTTRGINVSSEVPPILEFCVGQSISGNCSTASGNLVDLGDLNPNTASSGTSQMFAATNAQFGLNITVSGGTMTSGNNVIPALTTPTNSAPGNSQFGINLRANSNPNVGHDPTGRGVAAPRPGYNQPNKFAYKNGDVLVASSGTTDIRTFTVSYLVNISPSQAAGYYATTLTYIATAAF